MGAMVLAFAAPRNSTAPANLPAVSTRTMRRLRRSRTSTLPFESTCTRTGWEASASLIGVPPVSLPSRQA